MKRPLHRALVLLVLITLVLPSFLRPGPAAADGRFLWWDSTGKPFATFGGGGAITIDTGKFTFINDCPSGGVADAFLAYTDIYIVPSGSVTVGGELQDTSNTGEPNTVLGTSEGLFIGETIGYTAPSGAVGGGSYAVIYDECQNGRLDPEDAVFDPAFAVAIDADVPPLPNSFQSVKLDAFQQAQQWRLITAFMRVLFVLLDIRSFNSAVKGLLRGGENGEYAMKVLFYFLNKTYGLILGADPKEAALVATLNNARHYSGIAADPPDPNFEQPTPLGPHLPIDGATPDPAQAAAVRLGSTAASEQALLQALLASLERYQGAELEGDGTWALVHARAVKQYSDLLTVQLAATNGDLAALHSTVAADWRPFDADAAELEAIRAQVAGTGFTPEERLAALNLGLTDAQLDGLRGEMAGQSYAFDRADMLGQLAGLQATNAAAIGHLQALSADMAGIIATLQADPAVAGDMPVAHAGGPYAAGEGSAIAFDGAASVSTSPITAYEWDLDGDGEFDDATGATPSRTYALPFRGLVGLRVTNRIGLVGVGYAPVAVTATNEPPAIATFAPLDVAPEVLIGASLPFGVTATDPDGDPIQVEWRVDGAAVGTGAAYTYTPTAQGLGVRVVEAVVSDGQVHGGAVRQHWYAVVLGPDVDGDLWRGNVDCDDGDPAVNPGRPEAIGNGKDDDCDPATTDTGSAPTAAFDPQPQGGGRNVALLEAGAKIVAVTSQAVGAPATEMLDHSATDAPWRTTGVVNQSATVELVGGKTYLIDRVQLRLGASDGTNRVRNFEVAVAESLGGPYTTVLAATAAANAELQDFPLSKPVSARYVRYTPLTNGGGPLFATQQLKVFTGQEGGGTVAFTDRSTDPDDNLVSRLWDFGDGRTSAEQHPTHTYAAAGTYNVTLTVTDAAGQTSAATLTQRVLTAPLGGFTVDPATLKEGTNISFRPQASDPDGGQILAITWRWGDGSTPQTFGPGAVVGHEFPDNGTYTVTVEAVDDQGQVGQAQQTLTIANVAPTATFAAPKLATDGGSATIALKSATDAGDADKAAGFTYAFDCGTGYAAPTTSNATDCPTVGAVTFTFKGKVIDKEGAATEYTATAKAASVTLSPAALTVVPGTQAKLTAKVTDASGAPLAGVPLDLVLTGDNTLTPQATTDASGVANFAYSASLSGLDQAVARERGHTASSNAATITWAQPGADVLILSTTVGGGATGGAEGAAAKSLGLTIEVIAPNGWGAKTTADFAKYKAIILGDGQCRSLSVAMPAQNNTAVWGAAVTGNVVVVGTDNAHHWGQGGRQLTERGIAFAANEPGETGAFLSLSCYYHGATPGTPVWLLDGVAPGLTARGVGCYNDAHIVATHPALEGLTDGHLSNWSCSVHEAFDNWPADFQVLAIAEGIGGYYTAPDGTTGTPYIIARGRDLVPISDIKLTPAEASKPIGSPHTITATVAENNTPTPGRSVTFKILSGPHAGRTGTATTAADGKATFTYTGATAGTDTVEATMVDGAGKTQTSNRVTVAWGATPNSAPVVDTGPDAGIVAGGAFAGAGSFADPDADTWTATVDYGDGAGAQPLMLNDKDFALGHTYVAAGTYTVTVVVNDGKGGVGTDTLVVSVSAPSNVVPVVSAGADAASDEGSAFAATGSFADADADTWTATVDYGDGAGAQPLTLSGKGFALGHTYTDNGIYTVTVAVSDGKGGVGTDTLVVTVANVAPAATLANDGPVAIGAAATVGFINTADPSSVDTAAGLRYAFACDGAALDGATYAGADATPSTTCAFDASGSKTVRARIIDKDGGFTERTTVVVVNTPANLAPIVAAGPDHTGDEGAAIALAGAATDPEGAALTLAWTVAPAGTCQFADPAAASTAVTCGDNGVYTVTLTASDGVNPPVSASATVAVVNAAPALTITAPETGALYAVNTVVNLAASFTDAGRNDTHTCAIDWADGAGAQAGAVSESAGAGTCIGSRTFGAAGVYTIRMTVTDDDGGAATASVLVVVYDPSAGFVTGGGWIASPAGACRLTAACQGATGKATFGFVAKYKKGVAVPEGNTEFQFHAGGLNFKATAYDWLVVAGSKAKYKGRGTINGSGDYGFLVTAIDGQPDRFRIKIWDRATGDVAYDNQPGAGDESDAATDLGGGSIVIHSK